MHLPILSYYYSDWLTFDRGAHRVLVNAFRSYLLRVKCNKAFYHFYPSHLKPMEPSLLSLLKSGYRSWFLTICIRLPKGKADHTVRRIVRQARKKPLGQRPFYFTWAAINKRQYPLSLPPYIVSTLIFFRFHIHFLNHVVCSLQKK